MDFNCFQLLYKVSLFSASPHKQLHTFIIIQFIKLSHIKKKIKLIATTTICPGNKLRHHNVLKFQCSMCLLVHRHFTCTIFLYVVVGFSLCIVNPALLYPRRSRDQTSATIYILCIIYMTTLCH